MSLTWSPRTDAADWLLTADVPWPRLVGFGPGSFEAYARLRFVPDPVRPGQGEADEDLGPDHPRDVDQVRRALEVLADFTETPERCWFAVWEGYPGSLDLPPELPRVDVLDEVHGFVVRSYGLLRGGVNDLEHWDEVAHGFPVPPAFVWPDDHRWCIASDVDPHWVGIGAEDAAVRALLSVPDLDLVRADPEEEQPHF